jgi:hypothetical protein
MNFPPAARLVLSLTDLGGYRIQRLSENGIKVGADAIALLAGRLWHVVVAKRAVRKR